MQAYGMESITNLIVRRAYGTGGKTIALNAHGDVVPPAKRLDARPHTAPIVNGAMYVWPRHRREQERLRLFTFAVRALEAVARPAQKAR